MVDYPLCVGGLIPHPLGGPNAMLLRVVDSAPANKRCYCCGNVSQRRKDREQISLRLDRVSAKKGVKTQNTPKLASLAIG